MNQKYTTDSILALKAECWRERLRKSLKERHFTQESFIEAINKKHNEKFGQKDASRWMNVGSKKGKSNIGFPKYRTMILIADALGVDVGYLTGETDMDSFDVEKTSKFLGLGSQAINHIRKFTNPENTESMMYEDNRVSLDLFLSGDVVSQVFSSICDVYQNSIRYYEGKDISFFNLDQYIDDQRNRDLSSKVARFELNEGIILLVNEVFPIEGKMDPRFETENNQYSDDYEPYVNGEPK
jgi:transcriptional regulator with XRE-family HTH domain